MNDFSFAGIHNKEEKKAIAPVFMLRVTMAQCVLNLFVTVFVLEEKMHEGYIKYQDREPFLHLRPLQILPFCQIPSCLQ